jgi:small subunit ribosomal protein S16
MGHRHRPFYRLTVADSRVSATKKFLQHVGHYDPAHNPPLVKIDEVSIIRWLKQGAQPSDTVRSLLHRHGLLEKFQRIASGKAKEDAPLKARAFPVRKKPKLHKKAKEAAAKAAPAKAAEAAPAAAEAPAA